MGRYLIRRLLQLVPVFFGATFLVFYLVYSLPGDPIRALAGDRPIAPQVRQQLEDRYNLDDPLLVQYGKYLGNLAQGDFGESYRGVDVADTMKRRFPVTIRLALTAFAFEVVFGMLAGVLAGLSQKSFVDSLVLVSTTAVVSIPIFVLGFVAQLLFGLRLGWFPVAGLRDGWLSYVLPGMVLASLSLAYVARLLRTSLAENMRADYVRTAKAKGLRPSQVVGRHALRNSLIPVMTFLAVDLGALMGGAIVTEGIFNIPGIGLETFRAVRAQEGAVVVGITTALILVYIVASLVVDVLYAFLDPRIRYD